LAVGSGPRCRISATTTTDMVPMTSRAPNDDNTLYTYDEFPGTTSQQWVNVRTPRALIRGSREFPVCRLYLRLRRQPIDARPTLVMKRQAARKTVNVFVCNQTILDLVATFVLVLKHSLLASGHLTDWPSSRSTSNSTPRSLWRRSSQPITWLVRTVGFRIPGCYGDLVAFITHSSKLLFLVSTFLSTMFNVGD